MSLYPGPGNETGRIEEQLAYRPRSLPTEPLNILIWRGLDNEIFGSLEEGEAQFVKESCLVTQCRLTGDRSKLDSADLVIFQGLDSVMVEGEKREGQLWMISTMESPPHFFMLDWAGLDWTATYRRDSTIVTPYGAWRADISTTDIWATNIFRNNNSDPRIFLEIFKML